MNEDIKVLNVGVKPVGTATDVNLQQTMQDTAQVMNEALNGLEETTKEKEAKNYLNSLKNYIKGSSFKSDIEEVSKKCNIPPKQVAQNFFEKALGTVGDILGIAISVVCNAGRMVINLASTVCHSIVNLIQSIFSGLASIVTLNKTCVA